MFLLFISLKSDFFRQANKPKVDNKKAKKAPRIKLELDRIKGDFDVFLKDSHGGAAVADYEDDDDDFM